MNAAKNNTQSRWRVALWLALWTVLGLLFASKIVMEQRMMGRSYPWTKALWWQLMEWHTWGVLTLLVARACRRLDVPRGRWGRYVVCHVGLGIMFSLIQAFIASVAGFIEMWLKGWPPTPMGEYSFLEALQFTLVNHLHFNLLVYAAIVLGWNALHYHREAGERAVKAAELETQLAQAQLQALRAQLQPHFLFNTLNTIAEMVYEDPAKAEQMILRLGELLRLTLQSQRLQQTPLAEEISFLKSYLEIEQARLGSRLQIEWDVAAETMGAQVPNFILQPLVENAIRHGIAPFKKSGSLAIQARRSGETLLLQVRDSGPGLPQTAPGRAGHGIGLANTEARLRGLFGDRQSLKLVNDRGLAVTVAIPFSLASQAAPK